MCLEQKPNWISLYVCFLPFFYNGWSKQKAKNLEAYFTIFSPGGVFSHFTAVYSISLWFCCLETPRLAPEAAEALGVKTVDDELAGH